MSRKPSPPPADEQTSAAGAETPVSPAGPDTSGAAGAPALAGAEAAAAPEGTAAAPVPLAFVGPDEPGVEIEIVSAVLIDGTEIRSGRAIVTEAQAEALVLAGAATMPPG